MFGNNKVKISISVNEKTVSFYKPFNCTINLKNVDNIDDTLVVRVHIQGQTNNYTTETFTLFEGLVYEMEIQPSFYKRFINDNKSEFTIPLIIPTYNDFLLIKKDMDYYKTNFDKLNRNNYLNSNIATIGVYKKSEITNDKFKDGLLKKETMIIRGFGKEYYCNNLPKNFE